VPYSSFLVQSYSRPAILSHAAAFLVQNPFPDTTMPSIYDWKPRFQARLRPLTRWLAAVQVTANQVTVLAALISILTGVLVSAFGQHRHVLLSIPVVLFVRMALNAIDGMLAREHGMKSRLGAILNEIGDVASDSALYLPLALVPGFSPSLVTLVVVLAITSEMAGVVSVEIGGARRYDGPMGKSDRAFVFGCLCGFLGLGVKGELWINLVLGGVVLLLVLTIVNRCRQALRETSPP
jgi:CDP-diacylglycerol--glycerol-3-phosphate 3-phosphatidyltransferase